MFKEAKKSLCNILSNKKMSRIIWIAPYCKFFPKFDETCVEYLDGQYVKFEQKYELQSEVAYAFILLKANIITFLNGFWSSINSHFITQTIYIFQFQNLHFYSTHN